MKKKIFISNLIVAAISIVIIFTYTYFIITEIHKEDIENLLRGFSRVIIAEEIENDDFDIIAKKYSNQIGNSLRITFVRNDGTVLGDSVKDIKTMENHSDRSEIIQAINNREGFSIRFSTTIGESSDYYAARYNDDVLIRLSMTTKNVFIIYPYILPLIFLILALILISIFVSRIATRKITKPLDDMAISFNDIIDGKYESITAKIDDELVPIAKKFELIFNKTREYLLQIKKEGETLETILDNMREGIIILDETGNILLINSGASKLLDIKENMKEKNILEVIRKPILYDAVTSAISQGEPSVFDFNEKDADRTLRFYVNQIKDDNSNINGALVFISDVTQIIKADRVRTDFVVNVSHELKTPLTSIKGFAELVFSGLVKDEKTIKKNMNMIIVESERLITLINDILKLAEMESESIEIVKQEVNIKENAKEIAEILRTQANDNNISIEIKGDNGIYSGDPRRVYELLINLMENAVKYNKQGGKVMVNIVDSPSYIEIAVTDTGIGIPKEDLDRIFERFYRVDKGRSKKSGGTGLGLSIVKHIVNIFKGEISIESVLNEGTTIKIKLPKNY